MDHRLIEGLMEAIAPVIRESIAAATAPLIARIKDLEAKAPAKGDPGEPGQSVTVDDVRPVLAELVAALPVAKDGTSVTLDDVRPLINEAVAALPKPQDGKSVTVDDVRPVLAELVAAMPVAKDGTSVTLDDVRPLINEAVAALPKPQDGKSVSVDDMRPVLAELVAGLPPAKDGVGLASALIDRDGGLVVTMTDGRQVSLGVVVGRDGKDGEPGKVGEPGCDGFGFDDLDAVHDGERMLSLRFVKGEHKKEFQFTVPAIIDRGVWREGRYKAGDGVSHDGSWFVAQVETDKRPGTTECGWRLAAKRGRDGGSAFDVAKRNGFKGNEVSWLGSLKGESGPQGKPGRDLTQLSQDGRKY